MFEKSYNGIGEQMATFGSAFVKDTDEDKPVKVSANDTVALTDDDDVIHGVVRTIEPDGTAGVQIEGFVTLPYTSTPPTVGISKLLSDAANGVKVDIGGQEYIVVNVDTVNSLVTFKL